MSIPNEIGNTILRHEIDDMRQMPHPTKPWLWEHKHGAIRVVIKYLPHDRALASEAMAEVDALKRDKPAKPYQKQVAEQF